MVDGTGDVIAEIVNADGTVIERWTLKNAWLKAASWSDLDYTNDELRTIDITFRYDWAQCQNMVTGVMATEQFTSVTAGSEPTPHVADHAAAGTEATDDTTAT